MYFLEVEVVYQQLLSLFSLRNDFVSVFIISIRCIDKDDADGMRDHVELIEEFHWLDRVRLCHLKCSVSAIHLIKQIREDQDEVCQVIII